jgi:hypothetical protein
MKKIIFGASKWIFGARTVSPNLREKEIRQPVETELINIVKTFGVIFNKKIPNFKFIKKLCFS